jgi:GDP-L-fucose synthase
MPMIPALIGAEKLIERPHGNLLMVGLPGIDSEISPRGILQSGSARSFPNCCAAATAFSSLLEDLPLHISGIKLSQSYRSQHGSHFIAPIAAKLFCAGDNFDPAVSHVVPARIRKVGEAKHTGGVVSIWGTGTRSREFLFVNDAADAIVFLMHYYDGEDPINIGCGEDITIRQLAEHVAEAVGSTGAFEYDTSEPDGMPRKRLDSAPILALGWRGTTKVVEGLRQTIA